jgi:hypothetical protein
VDCSDLNALLQIVHADAAFHLYRKHHLELLCFRIRLKLGELLFYQHPERPFFEQGPNYLCEVIKVSLDRLHVMYHCCMFIKQLELFSVQNGLSVRAPIKEADPTVHGAHIEAEAHFL